jgi:hypothetical protein
MYSIDTSALMTWWIRRYPPDVFPGIVACMEKLTKDGRLFASEYVLKELGEKKDPLFDWANAQRGLFVATDAAVQQRAAQLIAQYPILIDPTAKRPVQADPFVIALAAAQNLTVVTSETYAKTKTSGKRKQRTYIPDVCVAEGVVPIDFLEMMRREGWKF